MVASTIYGFEDQLAQICATLSGFGYVVWNSHLGTIPLDPLRSNLDNCVAAARGCDAFLGIVRPSYGSGVVGNRSITHEEFLAAIASGRPHWFLVDRVVTIARQLLKPYLFTEDGARRQFVLRKNPVIDDLRVIDMYHAAIQNDVPISERRGHWVQEYHGLPDVLRFVESQFKDEERVRRIICAPTDS